MRLKLLYIWLHSLVSFLCIACQSQQNHAEAAIANELTSQNAPSKIGDYVVDIFQDKKGNLWFGTLEKGVAKYDGKKLVYLTTKEGLPSNRIVQITEDNSGHLWFGTGAGISKFDGQSFDNYSEKDGLCSDMISKLLIDSQGNFWIGTWGGVCTYDGLRFVKVALPYPKVTTKINPDTKDWITDIAEDKEGNIWFTRDGYGAVKYDGNVFTHYLKSDGLYSNNVTAIEVDHQGNVWFGSRVAEKDHPDPEKRKGAGGVTKFDGDNYTHLPDIKGLHESDVFEIYKDPSNHVWFSTTDFGVYQYDGVQFKNHKVPISIMVMKKDNNGNLWLGGAGGLYKIDTHNNIIYIDSNGPWN